MVVRQAGDAILDGRRRQRPHPPSRRQLRLGPRLGLQLAADVEGAAEAAGLVLTVPVHYRQAALAAAHQEALRTSTSPRGHACQLLNSQSTAVLGEQEIAPAACFTPCPGRAHLGGGHDRGDAGVKLQRLPHLPVLKNQHLPALQPHHLAPGAKERAGWREFLPP